MPVMPTTNDYDDVLSRLLGNPDELALQLEAFARDAEVFSSALEHLIAKYPKQWVAVYDGKVQATSPTLPGLLETLDHLQVPRDRAIVRFIDRNERTMIL